MSIDMDEILSWFQTSAPCLRCAYAAPQTRPLQEACQNFFDANIQCAKSEPVFMACTICALTKGLLKLILPSFKIFLEF